MAIAPVPSEFLSVGGLAERQREFTANASGSAG
jgi:hypothetical protein